MKTLAIMVGLVGTLAGCEMDQTSTTADAPARPFPDATGLAAIAQDAYFTTMQHSPKNLQVGDVQQARTFIGLPPDYLVCVSATENTVYSVYDNAGNLVAPAGVPFRQSYVMLVRDYGDPTGWGSGIFRRVEEGKIGHVEMRSVCPPSER